jgi:hypothetical protein
MTIIPEMIRIDTPAPEFNEDAFVNDEIIRKLQAAKFVAEHGGEVCPMNWKPG